MSFRAKVADSIFAFKAQMGYFSTWDSLSLAVWLFPSVQMGLDGIINFITLAGSRLSFQSGNDWDHRCLRSGGPWPSLRSWDCVTSLSIWLAGQVGSLLTLCTSPRIFKFLLGVIGRSVCPLDFSTNGFGLGLLISPCWPGR